MKLFPKESGDEFFDTLIAVLWVIGVLAVGTLIVWLVGLLINVSVQSPLGIGGAVAVVLLAAGVGFGVFLGRRRKRHSGANRQDKRSKQSIVDDGVAPLVGRVSRPKRLAPPQDKAAVARPVDALNPHNPDDLFQLKRQLADSLEMADFDKAESIVLRIEEADGQRDWCQIQRQAIQLKRRRSG